MVVIGDLNRRVSTAGRAALLLVLAVVMLFVPARALAATPSVDINSAGPLTDIWVGNELSCQIAHSGDTSGEFYPPDSGGPADCGTFLDTGGTLYGPDFTNHAGGTAVYSSDTPFTAGAQSGVTGAGTAASPYAVTTTVDAELNANPTGITITELDSYIVGNEFYRIDITVNNTSRAAITGFLYHAGDCYLQGSDSGYGSIDPSNGAPGCTANPNNSPPGEIEEFSPITTPIHYVEDGYDVIWSAVASGADLPDTCDCTSLEDNAEGINWDVSIPAGGSATYSMLADFSDTGQAIGDPTVVTGSATAVTGSGATLGGSVNPQGAPVTSCEFQWGTTTAYGNTAPCAQPPGSGTGTVPVSAAITGLSPTTAYHFRTVAANAKGTSDGLDQTFTTPSPPAVIASPPAVIASPPAVTASGAAFAGLVNPEGLATSAFYEYGLDPKYSGGGPIVYTNVTPTVALGAGTAAVAFNQSVSGLVPHALYHFRLVATSSAGTTNGPDQTFTTATLPNPPAPTLGKTENAMPVSGLVLIKFPAGKGAHIAGVVKGQGFIPLTQARQVPVGSQIDARRGTLNLVVATTKKRHTNSARLSGGVFSLDQQRSGPSKGLSTLALLENAFSGAPSYSSCTTKKTGKSVLAAIAKLNPKVLQTLSVSDNNGKFRTKGRYSAATERGTSWETQDRCDGTLTIVKRGTVNVDDFHTRKTIIVHAGHSFLATATTSTTKKKK